MPELAWLLPLGFAVGAFGTLVGAGGGFVLVPVLLLLYPDMKPATVTSISLLVVCANAASASLAYGLQRRIDIRSGLMFGTATLPGAIAGSIVVGYLPRERFDLLFAAVLGAAGVFLIFWRPPTRIIAPPRGRWIVRRTLRDRHGNTFSYSFRGWAGILISGCVGFFSSLLGVGGGFIHVPLMTAALHFPVHLATATSQLVLLLVSSEGTAVHVANGDLGWDQNLARAAFLAVGAIAGAQTGARISRHVPGHVITRLLAFALVVVAARIALGAI